MNEFIPQFQRILVSVSRKLSMEYLTIRIYLEDKEYSLCQYTYHNTLILHHHHWMSSFCNCAISLTNCKFTGYLKLGLDTFYVMSSSTSFVHTYHLPIERSVVSKLHSTRESKRERESNTEKKKRIEKS